jgi:hypothetical protein
MVFLTKLGFENLKNQVTPSPFRKVRGGGVPKYDPNYTDHPMQVPQDITLGLLWPKFAHKYCIQREIIKI